MSEPDLFVVCKNCSSEVSPYVTECPYCGQRVRKRAPKIERRRGEEEQTARRRRVRPPRLTPLRRDEIPGIAAEGKPFATVAVIVLSLAVTIVLATDRVTLTDVGGVVFGRLDGDYWRLLTAPFVYQFPHAGYEFAALLGIGVFGTLVERRFGPVVTILLFLGAGAAGAALAIELEVLPALGGNAAALGLLAAWFVDDRLAARRSGDRGNDLIGVGVFAAVLLLLPLADTDASWIAGLGGAAVGAIAGAVISPFRP